MFKIEIMKKLHLVLFLSVISYLGFSQKLNIKVHGGYGFGVQGNYYSTVSHHSTTNYDSSYTQYVYEAFRFSMGKGFRYGLSLGTQLFKNMEFELDVEYFKGKPNEMNTETIENYDYNEDFTVRILENYKISGKMVQITPAFVIKRNHEIFIPFIKLGGIVSFCSMKEDYELRLTNSHPWYYPFESITSEFEYDTRLSTGFLASFGFEYYIFDDVYLFSEVKYNSIFYTPEKGEYTKYEYRGDDILNTLTTNERYLEFVDKYDSSDNDNPSTPGKHLKVAHSFNNISLIAGLRINIFK